MTNKVCLKCGNQLSGKQERYCSPRCQRIYLKSQYRKRHRDKVNQYNREYLERRRQVSILAKVKRWLKTHLLA